jgi:hypothetical protein
MNRHTSTAVAPLRGGSSKPSNDEGVHMHTMKALPKIVLTAAFLAATLGACTKKDAGIGGEGDAAHVTSRTPGEGNSVADGTVAGTGNTGNAGTSATEYNTNNTPRTVGNDESTKEKSVGASGGASGVDMVAPDKAGPGANGSSGTAGTGATGTGASPLRGSTPGAIGASPGSPSTGSTPQAGATPGAPPSPETGAARGVGTKTEGHTGDTTGTGPASTKTGAGR